jgi:hypothetical protein
MDADAEAMTAELAEELSRNGRRRVVDPREVPWRHHHLRAAGQSGAHAYQSFQDDDEQTLSMRLGSGTHALLFGKPVALWDQPAANGKGGKAPRNGKVWDAFRAANPYAVILTRSEMDRATKIANAIKAHPEASRLLFSPGVLHESTILWRQAGRARRSTPDARHPDYIAELKTTKCAQPERFARDAMYRGYHAQVADQMDAAEAADGLRPESAFIVAVETVEPFVVTVLQLTERALQHGTRLNRMWFERLCACVDSNSWPGYMDGVGTFDVPDADVDVVLADGGDA